MSDSANRASSAIAYFKERESAEAILLVIDNHDAKKVLVAWTMYPLEYNETTIGKNESDAEAWERIWYYVYPIHHEKIARIAGVPYSSTLQAWNMLRTCRLIYPDGTISKNCQAIIATEVKSYLRAILPKNAGGRVPLPSERPVNTAPQMPPNTTAPQPPKR